MAEESRIEEVTGLAPNSKGIKSIKPNPFIDGPAEFLTKWVVIELSKVAQFKAIFGDFIDAYPREDYPVRALPALRVYNETYEKSFESWWITGDLILDVIYPASLRRSEHQEIPDVLSSALLQQFSRPTFFETLRTEVFGLNELGKSFRVEKNLGFQRQEEVVPLTRITANFRINIEEWRKHLEDTNRTVDEPFKETLGNLDLLAGIIQGLRDNDEIEVTMGTEQHLKEE